MQMKQLVSTGKVQTHNYIRYIRLKKLAIETVQTGRNYKKYVAGIVLNSVH